MATKQGKCGWCGEDPARGLAKIGNVFYCHEGEYPTCYMKASQRGVSGYPAPRNGPFKTL